MLGPNGFHVAQVSCSHFIFSTIFCAIKKRWTLFESCWPLFECGDFFSRAVCQCLRDQQTIWMSCHFCSNSYLGSCSSPNRMMLSLVRKKQNMLFIFSVSDCLWDCVSSRWLPFVAEPSSHTSASCCGAYDYDSFSSIGLLQSAAPGNATNHRLEYSLSFWIANWIVQQFTATIFDRANVLIITIWGGGQGSR